MKLHLKLNGEEREFTVRAGDTLSELLRDQAGLTGVKIGCNEGTCGTCTVLLNGRPVTSCLVLAGKCEGAEVLTTEGLGDCVNPHLIQEAMVDAAGVQCGFCTPGIVMSLYALLRDNPDPTEDDVRVALDGNLCRCTGYAKIFDAAELAISRHKAAVAGGVS
ncbi:(2Fe-2S)-binding protein [Candidatus Poribacteria bacterium]|nr:(2Fe-2S)-binding protein [Candidatus Poribacteria bacterium]